jgi:hypothetical protein
VAEGEPRSPILPWIILVDAVAMIMGGTLVYYIR